MPPPKLNADEIKLRGTILGNDKELLQLHKTLVRGGLVTEEEFWETRKGLLNSQESLLKQKKATPLSSTFAETPLTATSGSEQKIILTPETIQVILNQNPFLTRAYSDLVPHRLGEKDFWTFYVRSKFFRSPVSGTTTRENENDNESEKNPLNSYYEEQLVEERKNEDAFILTVKDKDQEKVSRLVDLVATSEDHHTETIDDRTRQLIREQANKEGNLSLIRKFNLQSLRVVQTTLGTEKGASIPVSIEEAVELEDLKQSTELPLGNPISIYKDTNTNIARDKDKAREEPSEQDVLAFMERVRNFSLGGRATEQLIEELSVDYLAIQELFSPYVVDQFEESSQSTGLLEEIPSDAKIFHGHALEVLQHFWHTLSLGRDTERQAKLTRLNTILEQFEKKGHQLMSTNSELSRLLVSIIETINFARETFKKLVVDSTKQSV